MNKMRKSQVFKFQSI